MVISPFKGDKGKFEALPIVFRSRQSVMSSNSILDDGLSDRRSPDGEEVVNDNNRKSCSTNGTPTVEHVERPEISEDEIYRPSNEYVLNIAFFSFLGFMAVQAIFALVAHSESLLTDSAAMSVDALTYLFNLCAERIKSRPYTPAEIDMPRWKRLRTRKLKRLYLELVPPLISVSTLLAVTIVAFQVSIETLWNYGDTSNKEDDVDDVNVGIMLCFSALNLLLDLVNVMCFAKAHQAFGLNTSIIATPGQQQKELPMTERTPLLTQSSQGGIEVELEAMSVDHVENEEEDDNENDGIRMNLNMCSAWTHVCADTLRSIAVLIAAGIASVFQGVQNDAADAMAAMAVSIIIVVSLFPLLHGLFLTAQEIHSLQMKQNGMSLCK